MLALNTETGEYEVVDEQIEEVIIEDGQEKDKVIQLAEGLSNATTISQIRSVAKTIIEDENG